MSIGKKEKYYDYIINDLLDATQIIGNDGDDYWSEIEFPFNKGNTYGIRYLDLTQPASGNYTNHLLFNNFSNYVKDMYGVTNNEVVSLWYSYLENLPI